MNRDYSKESEAMSDSRTVAEIFDEIKNNPEPEAACNGNGFVDITIPGGAVYSIELDRCSTAAEILVWVLHLSEKTWATPGTLNQVAVLAAKHWKIKLPWGC
jgi:hypothetical protein